MKAFRIFILLIISTIQISIAQLGLVDKYQYNYLAINPAFAGENGTFGIKAISENSFNPNNLGLNKLGQVLIFDGQLYGNAGLAFQGYRSSLQGISNTGLSLSYSKGYDIGEVKIKGGLLAGIFIQPNVFGSSQISQRIRPYSGFGTLASYKGAFIGISNPLILSKNLPEPKTNYIQAGYFYDNIESPLKFNANAIVRNSNFGNIIDYNLKFFYKNRLAVGASFRKENIKYEIFPFATYRISNSTLVGLGYVKNPGQILTNSQNGGNSYAPLNSVFQIFFQYSKPNETEELSFGHIF